MTQVITDPKLLTEEELLILNELLVIKKERKKMAMLRLRNKMLNYSTVKNK